MPSTLKDAAAATHPSCRACSRIGRRAGARGRPDRRGLRPQRPAAGNFLDDGDRLWLIDWDYAGFNSPLFDLGGLASNNESRRGADERWLLEAYFGARRCASSARRYQAMKCASLLRETMWSMVSELHSTLDFDYAAYTADNLGRFEAALAALRQSSESLIG